MRARHAAVLALALAPGLLAAAQLPASVDDGDPGPHTGERVFTLVMDGTEFNGLSWPNTPLLEAYAGETMRFVVHTPLGAEPHTFHMHGHPWHDADRGMIDSILLKPGETHDFNVTAGLDRGLTGDWFYHCHMDTHFDQGMWGLLRVYPYGMEATGTADAFRLEVRGPDGEALPAQDLDLRFEGEPVDAAVEELARGTYRVETDLPADEPGRLVVAAENQVGESVLRLDVDAAGQLHPVRSVGDPGDVPGHPTDHPVDSPDDRAPPTPASTARDPPT